MTLRTSPGNYQVWLAVSDAPKESDKEAAKQFRTRVRRGAGADHSATGATRIAGSLNFKTKYAPDFPVVEITRDEPRQHDDRRRARAGRVARTWQNHRSPPPVFPLRKPHRQAGQ